VSEGFFLYQPCTWGLYQDPEAKSNGRVSRRILQGLVAGCLMGVSTGSMVTRIGTGKGE